MESLADLFPPGTDLCLIPAANPPEGYIPNFNDTGLKPVIISVSVITTAIAVFFGLVRLLNNTRKLQVSDGFVFLAIVGNVAIMVTLIIWARFFRPHWNLPLCWFDGNWMKISYVWQMCFCFSLFFSKTATLLLYLSIFTVSRSTRIAIWTGIALCSILYGASIAIASYFAAPHIGVSWDQLMVQVTGTVIFPLKWGVAQGAAGTLLDIYIFTIPLPVISRLKLSRKKKLQLLSVFAVGFLGIVASIVSLVYRAKSIQGPDPDGPLYSGILMSCSLVEMNVALLVCSTPAVANFMRRYVKETRFYRSLRSMLGFSELHVVPSEKLDPKRPRTGRSRAAPKHKRGHDADGIEMGDTWMLNSGATIDIQSPPQPAGIGGRHGLNVHKTVDVEHGPSTSSLPD